MHTIDHDVFNDWLRTTGVNQPLLYRPSGLVEELAEDVEQAYHWCIRYAMTHVYDDTEDNATEFERVLEQLEYSGFRPYETKKNDRKKEYVSTVFLAVKERHEQNHDFQSTMHAALNVHQAHRHTALDMEQAFDQQIENAERASHSPSREQSPHTPCF